MTRRATAFVALFVFGFALSSHASAAEPALLRDLWEFNNVLDSAVGMKVTDAGEVFGEYQVVGSVRRAMYSTEGQFAEPEGARPIGIASASDAGIRDVSADSTYVGYVVHEGVPQSVRWRFEALGRKAYVLEPLASPPVASEANAVTPDDAYIVGYTEKWGAPRAFRWTTAGGTQNLGALGAGGTSVAYGISNDGSIVVGESSATADGPRRAFRWTTSGMQSLGTLGGDGEETVALAISGDGTTTVGASETPGSGSRAIVHTAIAGLTALPTIDDYPGESRALSVSADGSVIAGWSQSEAAPQGEACVWIDGAARSLTLMLEDDYGLDLEHWDLREARCSPNGLRFTGQATHFGLRVPFMVRLGPGLEYPTIEGDIAFGGTYVVPVGETRDFHITITDPLGRDLAKVRSFSNERMNWGGPSIPTVPSPRSEVFRCQPTAVDYGKTYTFYASFAHLSFSAVSNIRFTIVVPPNGVPTVEPLSPVTHECIEGGHRVKLSTVVADADDHPLTVKWRVEGEIVKTVAAQSGDTVEYEADYEHGQHQVQVEVSDGYAGALTGTTVTVVDTLAPFLFVAPDVTIGTDAGEAYASNVALGEPVAYDGSGHPVTITNDAPESYPLGETTVLWTVDDESGNAAVGSQKVIVEDYEKPVIAGSSQMKVFVDPGKLFSTARPPEPAAFDNVTDVSQLQITSDAPARFPIGWTRVTFRATDDGGNFAEWPVAFCVMNHRPRANAGKNLRVTTKSERGVRIALDGSASTDLDRHKLKFAWSAPGARLSGPNSQRPFGMFPIGKTVVKLTVTDPAGLSHSDTLVVSVRIRNGTGRPSGRGANRSFAAASRQAAQSVAASRSNGAALTGLAYANAASAYGDAAGEFVRWEEGQSEADALLSYAELRAMQRSYGAAAANSLLSAYAETGDESLLAAYGYAADGTAYATADLSER